MMTTKIEWCDETWNPVTGCTPISDGCKKCYAKRMATRFRGRCGYPEDYPFRVTLHPDRLEQPFQWRKLRRIFVCSMGDLFHDDVPFNFIAAVFGAMAACPQHKFQILTKRPRRMLHWFDWVKDREQQGRELFPYDDEGWRIRQMLNSEAYKHINMPPHHGSPWPLQNAWIGVSVELAKYLYRVEQLKKIPAAVRFLSLEPLLGPIPNIDLSGINWVIVGAETGPGARPMNPGWARDIRDQCQAAGVPFFMKKMSGGAEPPADLMIREFPQ